MAKVIIAGNAVVINSSVKLEDLKKVEKYRPSALTLYGGEDGKEPVFRVTVGTGTGSINKNGACFSGATHDEAKLATITMVVGNTENIKEFVADEFGGALINLSKIEEKLPGIIADIASERNAVMNSISVAGTSNNQ